MISLFLHSPRASIVARNTLRTIYSFARLNSQWTRPSRLSSGSANMASITDILAGKYPAKLHAQRVAKSLLQQGGDKDGVIYLEAQKTVMQEDSDHPAPFRQRRFFYYLTGCNLPDCYLTYDMAKDHLTLFIPPIDPEDVVWSGLPLTPEEAMEKYDIDAVKTTDEINPCLANKEETPQSTVYAIDGQVSTHVTFLSFANKNMDLLKETIENCRVIKSDYEIAMIRHANEVSTKAHVACMRAAKKVQNEQELQAIFIEHCIAQGCKEQAYTGIFASGEAAATLHYIHNDKATSEKLNLLLDAGAEYRCYASDITRTFPLDGKFTKESRAIYDIVLRMQMECISLLKEGVLWDDVHAHAHKIAIEGLLDLGVLRDGTVQEIFDARTSVAFFPHGLGHYLGMDTHDTGGNANYSDKDQMFRYLRVRGTLPAGSVITVEPGVYFCRFIIEPYLKDPTHGKYINSDVLEKYWQVGGVRIEDNVLITKDGSENLTPTPKTVEEMEQIMT